MIRKITASRTASSFLRSIPWRISLLTAVALTIPTLSSRGSSTPGWTTTSGTQQDDKPDRNYYANARPYLEDPVEQLIKRIPELATIRYAIDQQALPTILEKTGEQVDGYFRDVIDLTAHEKITEEKLGGQAQVTERLQTEDSYLILRRGSEFLGRVNEYRMDSQGNRLEGPGLNKGYFVTSDFALSPAYFSTALQSECRYRYLGEEKVGSRDAYVVAFAQKPGEATVTVRLGAHLGGNLNFDVNMLLQGIAWVDKSNFQIIRLRTDLLAPRVEIRLDQLTTIVTFGEVLLSGLATPLSLPSDVQVTARFTLGYYELNFRNQHHYSDYQRYGASVKMLPEEAMGLTPAEVEPFGGSEQLYYADAHPYLDEPLDKLRKRIPELRKIQPAADLQQLPAILKKTASNVDNFFRNIVDLIAEEKITQERLSGGRGVTASERVRDSYLIVRHTDGAKTLFEEYRMDSKGNRVEQAGFNRGYLVTTGFALLCNYLSSAFQPESTFRYLGDQRIGSQDTYVVAFAQKPGQASLLVSMTGRSGARVDMLMQGIAWVDKSNFQILRMRTDLLAPRPEIALDGQTTEVTLSKVQLQDVATPLWLPSEVKVDLKFKMAEAGRDRFYETTYRNEHRYKDYRRYRVAVKMVTPQ
jgi:hypothetical protein